MAKLNRPKNEDIKSVRYTVRMGDVEDNWITKYCNETGKSKSDVLREALTVFRRGKEG